jgi:hypothetical protein
MHEPAWLQPLLISVPLLAPVALLFVPRSRLLGAIAFVLTVQLLAVWISGCLTSTWQCSDTCNYFYPVCLNEADGNDQATFGIAIITLGSVGLTATTSLFRILYLAWRRFRLNKNATA